MAAMSKAEYLQRYMTGGDEKEKEKKKKKRSKTVPSGGKGMKIVDDDVDWKRFVPVEMDGKVEEEEEAPVVAEVVDERPKAVRLLEEFRNSMRWKLLSANSSTVTKNKPTEHSPIRRKSRWSSEVVSADSSAPQEQNSRAAGLLSSEVRQKEKEENRRRERADKVLEAESQQAETVVRDKSGKKKVIDQEQEEDKEKAEKAEKYAQWGKGLAQGRMQQYNMEEALKESQKPLARHIDDEDLDKMLREQEREGDPMAGLLRKKKEKENQKMGIKERPKYKGPAPPPNRYNIQPGYRWDGVDRSNGFEKRLYSRMADKKATQEIAYKWSVENM
ncbi:BUD13 protein, partial [Polypterus senegalus]